MEAQTRSGKNEVAQCECRNARTALRTGHIARTANRLIEVMAELRVYWLAFRIVEDTMHLHLLIRGYALFVTRV